MCLLLNILFIFDILMILLRKYVIVLDLIKLYGKLFFNVLNNC